MARYSTGRRITTCRECAEIVSRVHDAGWVCGLRHVRVRLDAAIPRRCTLPQAPEREEDQPC